ncbi:DUF4116 domain-containing protein [Limnohabitans sp. 2KL-3]|uniref:DUF4116 domain-containing protein n=1 Tax=Limnohabitans sp. 2KL-3 TaxID=1100700 RepID=UPI000A42CDA9|nr:DUF4116 domain-containing protein [Limnohabitans sp. 2KL-3]
MNLTTLVDVLNTVKNHNTGFGDLNPAYWDPGLFTQEFHRSLVRFHWSAAKFVPVECLDDDLYAEIVLKDSHSLQVVPVNRLNIILRQVFNLESDRVYELLALTPAEYLEYETCLAAIQKAEYDINEVLQLIPDQFRTRELCIAFIKVSDSYLEDLPPDLQFDNMCIEMALRGCASINKVPEGLRTQEIYERAYFDSLEEIPESHRSNSLCMKAVTWDGSDLRFVPDHCLSDAVVLQAVTTTGIALEFVDERWLNKGVIAAALRSDPVATAWVPQSLRDTSEFREAASQLIGQITRIPHERLNHTYVIDIVAAEGRLLIELPLHFHTAEICDLAFSNHQLLLSKFPEEMKSREACLASVRHSWRSLRRVPKNYLFDCNLPDVCETAIRKGPFAFKYVPKNHPKYVELQKLAIQIAIDCGIDLEIIEMELR